MKDVLELETIKKSVSEYAHFSLGEKYILDLQPQFEELRIQLGLKRTYEAMEILRLNGVPPFGGIHDIRKAVEAAKKNVLCNERELFHCALLMRGCVNVQKYLYECEGEKDSLLELCDSMTIDLNFCKKIEACISPHYEIYDDASSELKRIRRQILQTSADITGATAKFIQANGSKLTDTITTTRNDRVCVLVKASEKNTMKGFIHGESASGATAYVEPESLLLLNNKLQALRSSEQEEIKRILFACSQEVKKVGDGLIANCETLGLLDSIFAKALYGQAIKGCVAKLDETNLYMKRARHPLIDPQKVIDNTYRLNDHRMLLITGSNTGGKTVTMKTIGLFVLMSYCGIPVSAEEVMVPKFDHVYVDIGDEQSIEQSLSTFSAHISKLAKIIEKANRHSLVILDELGSGTDPKEGEALAIAVLERLREIGCMVLASTHYSKLKTASSKWEDVLCSSVEFDMETMKPTYRYIEGISGQSNALSIASYFGLDDKILSRAKEIKEENESDEEKIMEDLNRLMNENLQKEEKLAQLLQEVNEREEKLAQQEEKWNVQKERILEEARQQASEIVEEAKTKSEEVIHELKESSNLKLHELLEIKRQLNDLEEIEEEQVSEEVFNVNDSVLIKKYNYYGEVLEVKPKYLMVLANGMKMKLSPSECTHTQKKKGKKKEVTFTNKTHSTVSLECNVIGERVVDALNIVDKYLDNALLRKLRNVRIVHGVGSGALRSAIWEYLKKNKAVESYRIGGEGEGGTGATVVTLKGRS